MQLAPHYDGPPVLTMDGKVTDPGLAVTRQRRRMERLLAGLAPDDWSAQSRCAAWKVRDVAAHLVTVNQFWEASVRAGLGGTPTRVLATFDPVAHPAMLVESLAALSDAEVLEQFTASNDGFLGVVAELSGDDWSALAESPVGHVDLERIVDHALWDAWVHERDIGLPLGLPLHQEADELEASLRYVAALSSAITIGRPGAFRGTVGVVATHPDTQFTVEVDDAVVVHEGPVDASLPCLRGAAADLIDALSLRGPLPDGGPAEWHALMQGLTIAFAEA